MLNAGPPPDGYRPCVGAAVFNDAGRTFVGHRADLPADAEYAWQLPQGGLDENEDPEAGARRELLEETGIRSVTLMGVHDRWLTYDFPPEVRGKKFEKYRGQAQLWFAYAFEGDVSEIDLGTHDTPEFSHWDWKPLDELPGIVIPFKRGIYEAIVTAFRPYAVPRTS